MERAVAIKRLGKLLGKSLGYRVDMTAPCQEDRDLAQARMSTLMADRKLAEEAMRRRREDILSNDRQYQALVAEYERAKKELSDAHGILHHFRFTVGTTDSLFFHVKAQGDSWEEVIRKLEAKP